MCRHPPANTPLPTSVTINDDDTSLNLNPPLLLFGIGRITFLRMPGPTPGQTHPNLMRHVSNIVLFLLPPLAARFFQSVLRVLVWLR